MAKKDFLINFNDPSKDNSSDNLSLSIDSDYNKIVYGDDKSDYFVDEVVYLKLVREIHPDSESFNKSLELITSSGTAGITAHGLTESVTEYVVFANITTGSLQSLPYGVVTATWLGRDLGTPVFTRKNVSVPTEGVGVLKCTYLTEYSRVWFIPTVVEKNVVVVVQNTESAVCEHDVAIGADEAGRTPYDVVVIDYCTTEPIPNAIVEINGAVVGTTNSSGVLNLGNLVLGQTYNIKVTAANYISSDDDNLDNEDFTVPE